MTALLTSDIHMTMNPRDEHRWGLFPWLEKEVARLKVSTLVVNGDLTDDKDRHPAALVDRMVTALVRLGKLCQVVVLKGNHDFVSEDCPFFGFVGQLAGVTFVADPSSLALSLVTDEDLCLFLPSTPDPEQDWAELRPTLNDYAFVFCHQTFSGCLRDNGTKSEEGMSVDFFKGYRGRVYSGDIHVPQRLGPVTYIGAPYRIDFGDRYTPRVLHVGAKDTALRFPCANKHLLDLAGGDDLETEAARLGAVKGDQVKVRVTLRRADYPLWPVLRKRIQALAVGAGWVLYGPELRGAPEEGAKLPSAPLKRAGIEDLVREFAGQAGADADLAAIGVEIAKSAQR